ncbi:MAG: tetratricopeptide repeat protein [Planctomycetota bacterium]
MNLAQSLILLSLLCAPALAQDELPAAVRKAKKAAEAKPTDANAQLALADAWVAADEPEEAWTLLENKLDEIKDDARLDTRLGDVFIILARKEQAGGGDGTTIRNFFMDAGRMYEEALKKDAKSADAMFGRAFIAHQLGEKDKAQKAIGDTLALDKDYARAHALRAEIFYFSSKFADAANNYEIALKLDTSNAVDFVRLGHSYMGIKKPEKAREAYIAVLKHHPDYNASIRSGLINQLAQRDTKRATPFLKQATEEAPKSPAAWFYYGYSLELNEMFDKALGAYKRALALRPKNAQYLYYVGWMHEKKNDGRSAMKFYKQALEQNANYRAPAQRYYRLAYSYASSDWNQFAKLMEELIKLTPNDANMKNDFALLMRNRAESTGQHKSPNPPAEVRALIKRSGEVYEMAAKLSPNVAQIQSDTGLLFEFYPCNYDPEKAEAYFVRSLEVSDYTYRDAWSGILRLCRRTKNWEVLKDMAEGVLGSLDDSGRNPVAPVGGSAPRELPQFRAAMIASAKNALALAEKGLAEKK